MSQSFEMSDDLPVRVEEILSAFSAEDYWLDRLASFGGITTLNSLIVDADGTVNVATTQDLARDRLPGVITKFLPGDLKILRDETWSPIGDRRVQGVARISVPGAYGSGCGTAVLAPTRNGSRLTMTMTVEVEVPLIGAKIERYFGARLAEQIPEMHRFTTRWIRGHA